MQLTILENLKKENVEIYLEYLNSCKSSGKLHIRLTVIILSYSWYGFKTLIKIDYYLVKILY